MEFYLKSLSDKPYKIAAPEEFPSPSLLLFRDRLRYNVKRIGELLESIAPEFGIECIWPHVKTHKSIWVTKQLMNEGMVSFKTTPNEVDMLVEAGAEAIFIAYPLVANEAFRIAKLAQENRHIRFIVQASHSKHIEYLIGAAEAYDVQWEYMIDLDVGMHRTGIHPEKAFDFYSSIKGSHHFRFVGFHGYDGHNFSVELEERRKTSEASVDLVNGAFQKFGKENVRVSRLMMGGTPSFLTDLECLSRINLDTEILLSPGTWVFFDTTNFKINPNSFDVAVCILAQIMDRPDASTATLNLGHKRWSVDQGPIESFSVDGMKALDWNEEHTVVSIPEMEQVNIGDYVLIAPRHVCSTVNLWDHFVVVDPHGKIETPNCPIDARNR